MKTFILATFALLTAAFYALSGGASFHPGEMSAFSSLRMARAEAEPAPEPAVTRARTGVQALLRQDPFDAETPREKTPAAASDVPVATAQEASGPARGDAPRRNEPTTTATLERDPNVITLATSRSPRSAQPAPAAFRMVDGRARPMQVVSRQVGSARFIRVPDVQRTRRAAPVDAMPRMVRSTRMIRYLPAAARLDVSGGQDAASR